MTPDKFWQLVDEGQELRKEFDAQMRKSILVHERPNMTPTIPASILRILAYSWAPIDFKWEALTDEEKRLISPDEFKVIAEEAKRFVAVAEEE